MLVRIALRLPWRERGWLLPNSAAYEVDAAPGSWRWALLGTLPARHM